MNALQEKYVTAAATMYVVNCVTIAYDNNTANYDTAAATQYSYHSTL